MAFTGSAIAAAKAGTPGEGKGASNAADHPTCQGHGLGFLNKNIRTGITDLQGKPGLGTFWQDPNFSPGGGPGATPAISLFFLLDETAGACEAAFGLPPEIAGASHLLENGPFGGHSHVPVTEIRVQLAPHEDN